MKVLPAAGLRHRLRSMPPTLLVGLAAALLAWIFVRLGSEMAEGEPHAFDMVILRAMQALRDSHPWLAAVMRDLSGLGRLPQLRFTPRISATT
jgi:undecaprenyl-diphosphatase